MKVVMSVHLCLKRTLCLLMSLVFLLSVVPSTVYAVQASSISTESLFMDYPQYLSNKRMNEGTSACESACYAVLNSYNNKGNSLLAAIITSLNDGLKLKIQDILSRFGVTNSYADENLIIATNDFLLNYLSIGTGLPDTANRIEKATKGLQKNYKTIKNIQKEDKIAAIRDSLQEYSRSLDLHFSSKEIEDLIKSANESRKLRDLCGEVSDGVDDALLITDMMVGLFQVYCFDLVVIQDLMTELERCNIKSSDLYRGLEIAYKQKTNGPIWHALQGYLVPEAVSALADSLEVLLYGVTGASTATVALTQVVIKGIANTLYTDAKADDIIQATYAVSFTDALELCVFHYRNKFLSKTGTSADIRRYEMVYRAWLSADNTALDICYKICKKKDSKELGTDCVNAQRGLKETYTYDNYIRWCKEELAKDAGYKSSATDQKPTLQISEQNLPANVKQGSNYGLRGTIKTDCGVIISVYGEITDLSGNVVQSGQHYPNKMSDNLRYSINNDLSFGQLSAGSYVYRVQATAKNGAEETTQTLIECQFQVQGESPAPTMPAPTEPAADQKPTVCLSGEKLPADLQQGSNFGIRGTVSTDYGVITYLHGSLIDAAGNEVQSGRYYPNTSSVDLRYTINNDLIFGNLSSGKYTYCVEATAQNGNEQTTQNLIRHSFQVYSTSVAEPAPPQTPVVTEPVQTTPPAPTVPARAPVLSVSGHNLPESQKVGQNFGIRGTVSTDCGTITELYGAIIDASGNAVCSGWYNPYSTTVDLRTTINNDLVFGTLGVGSYTYYVQARAENNGQQTVKTLIEHSFTVGAASESQQSEPALNSVGYNMTVNVGKGSTLRFCSTVSTADQYEIGSLPNGATVYVYGTTQQQYEGRTWAKISYNGTDGWVNYKWLY